MSTRTSFRHLLATAYDRFDIVVESPDHPHLALGPDVLLAISGSLTAWFRPNLNELNSPSNLIARVVLSRLALPPSMRPIVLLGRGSSAETVGQAVAPHVAAVVPLHDWREALAISLDRRHLGGIDPIDSHIRERHQQAFSYNRNVALELAIGNVTASARETVQHALTLYGSEPTTVPRLDAPHERARPVGRRHASIKTRRGHVAAIGDRADADMVRELTVANNWAVRLSYLVDAGIPYERRFEAKLLLADHPLPLSIDPLHSITAAAFGGWVLAPATGMESAMDILNRLQRRHPWSDVR